MKETEQTLLNQIKDQVAKEYYKSDGYEDLLKRGSKEFIDSIVDIIAERYATAKAQASCEATLKKAAENAKIAHPRHDDEDYEVNTNSITDPSNITIV